MGRHELDSAREWDTQPIRVIDFEDRLLEVSTAQPTQVEHKWRATTRTVFQAFLGLCAILPVLLPILGVSTTVGVGATVLAVAATVTRVMATPEVDQWITRWLPWLRTGG